jgi:hypothetical protein
MAAACSSFYMMANIGTAVGLATTSAIIQEVLKLGLHRNLKSYPDRDTVNFAPERIIESC